MIKHIVLFDLLADHDREEFDSIVEGVHELGETIAGFTHFEHGTNKDFGGMSAQFNYVFICHFVDEDTSRAYLVDPGHNALGQRLVNLCRGGVNGITIIDMAIAE